MHWVKQHDIRYTKEKKGSQLNYTWLQKSQKTEVYFFVYSLNASFVEIHVYFFLEWGLWMAVNRFIGLRFNLKIICKLRLFIVILICGQMMSPRTALAIDNVTIIKSTQKDKHYEDSMAKKGILYIQQMMHEIVTHEW